MNQRPNLIDVAIALPVHGIFSYSVPTSFSVLITVGKRVLVPFGRRRAVGYVLGKPTEPVEFDLKKVIDVLDDTPLFPESLVPLFKWISNYYMYPIGQVIKNALPGGLSTSEQNVLTVTSQGHRVLPDQLLTTTEKKILSTLKKTSLTPRALEKRIQRQIPSAIVLSMLKKDLIRKVRKLKSDRILPRTETFVQLAGNTYPNEKLSKQRQKILTLLDHDTEISLKSLRKIIPTASRIINDMAAKGQVEVVKRQVYRDPFGDPVLYEEPLDLTKEQSHIVDSVEKHLGISFSTFLLTGVTGSGKTEVYLQLAREALNRGLAVLVLVPEIALISQMERRFRSRFGDKIALLHSGLTMGERYDQWIQIAKGELNIAIGARSAIFAPLKNLGLIIVDEEHDASYKQETGLRYNARDIAVVRAKQLNAVALLGSATPSIQSYHNAVSAKYTPLSLTKRVQDRDLPDIEIVDLGEMRDQRGYRRYLSKELLESLTNTMQQKQQAILFLNRRGFANLPMCQSCGKAISCRNCDISMTYHQYSNAYRCHYCGFSRPAGLECPDCGIANIHHIGFGTEKIEGIVKDLFPDKHVVRMDRDTIVHRGALLKILKGLNDGSIDILIGTQMVAKGHDYPNVTLVGIICADLSLNFPDFRAGEQTFQLLAQVSGRAGRGEKSGKVILQTYNPGHFSILCAKHQNVQQFYDQEIGFRKELNYPPFSRMIQVIVSGKEKDRVKQYAQDLGVVSNRVLNEKKMYQKTIQIMGPIEAPFRKIATMYRWQILFKAKKTGPLHQYMQDVLSHSHTLSGTRYVKINVDVDPVFMM